MLFDEIVATSTRIAATRSRNEKISHLTTLLPALGADEIVAGVSFLSGRIAGGRPGVGPALLQKLDAAPASYPALTIADVDDALTRFATLQGRGAAGRRQHELGALFLRATETEQTFLFRLLAGELRQGALEGLMVEAVAKAAEVPAPAIRRASMLAGSLPEVALAALTEGATALTDFRLTPLTPVQPMLAQAAEDVPTALASLGELALEYKLDGVRLQLHKADDEVRLYTRHMKEITPRAPEVVELVRSLPARTLILDGEVLALRADGRPQPFQATMRRFGRKSDVESARADLPLSVYCFDCLHRDGDDLIDLPAAERWRVLEDLLPGEAATPRTVTADTAQAAAFLERAMASGHEGVMAKALDARYEAGSRGASWLKIKPVHTLDLVVLAAEWGHGRRRGRLSNLHLGARDPTGTGFVMLGKTFKGMSDAMLEWQTRRLQDIAVAEDGYIVHVRPELVIEIACNDVQESTRYPGGLALRFARVKRYREDKRACEANTLEDVRAIHAHRLGPAHPGDSD